MRVRKKQCRRRRCSSTAANHYSRAGVIFVTLLTMIMDLGMEGRSPCSEWLERSASSVRAKVAWHLALTRQRQFAVSCGCTASGLPCCPRPVAFAWRCDPICEQLSVRHHRRHQCSSKCRWSIGYTALPLPRRSKLSNPHLPTAVPADQRRRRRPRDGRRASNRPGAAALGRERVE